MQASRDLRAAVQVSGALQTERTPAKHPSQYEKIAAQMGGNFDELKNRSALAELGSATGGFEAVLHLPAILKALRRKGFWT